MGSQQFEGLGIAPTVDFSAPTPQLVVEQSVRAEIDMQISTAKKYKRSIKQFVDEASAMVQSNQQIAASCFYKLPRSGKVIQGPSVRLAEICVYCYQNTRSVARMVDTAGTHAKVEAGFADLERNNAITKEVMRRITDKSGQRYNDDMITVTLNAAAAIAWRNAVFGVIPGVYVQALFEMAKATAIGDIKSLSERRARMMEAFAKVSVFEDVILRHMRIEAVDQINIEELEHLFGIFTAIREGSMDADDLKMIDCLGEPIVYEDKKPQNPQTLKAAAERARNATQKTEKPETAGNAPGATNQPETQKETNEPEETRQDASTEAKETAPEPNRTRRQQPKKDAEPSAPTPESKPEPAPAPQPQRQPKQEKPQDTRPFKEPDPSGPSRLF